MMSRMISRARAWKDRVLQVLEELGIVGKDGCTAGARLLKHLFRDDIV
jgi:hypothetical protein